MIKKILKLFSKKSTVSKAFILELGIISQKERNERNERIDRAARLK